MTPFSKPRREMKEDYDEGEDGSVLEEDWERYLETVEDNHPNPYNHNDVQDLIKKEGKWKPIYRKTRKKSKY